MKAFDTKLVDFLDRINRSVVRATRNSRKFERKSRYDEIEYFLKSQVRSAEVHFYGSRMIGIANHYSDLDIYIEVGDTFASGISRKLVQKHITQLKRAMDRHDDWAVTIALLTATTPVLRCYYYPLGLKCDITFSSGLPVANTNLIHHLFDIQPEAFKLFHAIRIWFQIVGLKLRRYQLVILVIFFLQSEKCMPSIHKVQKNLKQVTAGGWKVQFDDRRTLKNYGCKPMNHFLTYLADFFEFYDDFDFDNLVVFPFYGAAIDKNDYPDQPALRQFSHKNLDGFKWERPMAMASLLSLDYNVTWDVGMARLQQFKDVCFSSYNLLINNNF